MNFDYDKYSDFNDKYNNKRKRLSSITVQMIDTMFCFINRKKINENKFVTKSELLDGYYILSMVIKKYNSEVLMKQFDLLTEQILNDENYLPLLIKLQCSVGLYPNEFLMGYARQIFDNEICTPIMDGYFKDEYAENNGLEIKEDTETEIDAVKQKVR